MRPKGLSDKAVRRIAQQMEFEGLEKVQPIKEPEDVIWRYAEQGSEVVYEKMQEHFPEISEEEIDSMWNVMSMGTMPGNYK